MPVICAVPYLTQVMQLPVGLECVLPISLELTFHSVVLLFGPELICFALPNHQASLADTSLESEDGATEHPIKEI